MRRIVAALSGVLALAAPLLAASGKRVVVESFDDFARGEAQGVRLDGRGGLGPAPQRHELARLPVETKILSMVRTESGELLIGTGFDGKIFRLGKGTAAQEVADLPELAVFALALGSRGEVYAAGSPGGVIYRVDPASRRAESFFETGETYVWDLLVEPDGAILAATGENGKLLRIAKDGSKSTTLLDAPDANLRTVARAPGGTLWVGSDGDGLVYRLRAGQPAEVVVDSKKDEIAALLPGKDGSLWVLATSGESPKRPPPAAEAKRTETGGTVTTDASSGTVTVTIEGAPAAVGGFELLRLRADDVVEMAAAMPDEVGFDLAFGPGGEPWVAAGPKGQIYSLVERQLTLLRDLPEKYPNLLVESPDGILVATADGPAVYRIGPDNDPAATYESMVYQESQRARWGAYRWEGVGGGGRIRVYFRSGGSSLPGEGWSEWLEVESDEGQIPAPSARYLQWRAIFESRGGMPPFLRRLTFHSTIGNLAPKVIDVVVHEPGEIFVRGTYGSGQVVVEAANPDELGLFTQVGEALERAPGGKKMFRRGFRTLTWKAEDPNEDPLLFDVDFRPAGRDGRGSGSWRSAARRLTEPQFAFDSSVLPDGRFLFRVTASDQKANPEALAGSDALETGPVTVDNGAPTLTVEAKPEGTQAVRVSARFVDLLSPLLRAEYSVDGGPWIPVLPEDGVADERIEEIRFVAKGETAAPELLILRVLDTSFNVTTKSALD